MGRIRNVMDEIKYEEEPMVIKKEKEKERNGYIPVKYEYAELWYSTSDKAYFAVFKIEGKKYRFELVK